MVSLLSAALAALAQAMRPPAGSPTRIVAQAQDADNIAPLGLRVRDSFSGRLVRRSSTGHLPRPQAGTRGDGRRLPGRSRGDQRSAQPGGVARKQLPKSVEAYRAALQRHLAIRNGKLMREFESLYDLLHIAGYYSGLLYDRTVVRGALDAAQRFIEKVA
jgi:Domain of unknown function (DUF5618)